MITMDVLLNYLHQHTTIIIVAVAIIFDTLLGFFLSVKDKKTYSSIGIDGMIRKASMLACIVFLVCLDYILHINIIGWLPEIIGWLPEQILQIFKIVHMDNIGISDVFSVLFVVFELLSILKNWALMGLPMFKGVNEWIEKFLETFTEELPKKD